MKKLFLCLLLIDLTYCKAQSNKELPMSIILIGNSDGIDSSSMFLIRIKNCTKKRIYVTKNIFENANLYKNNLSFFHINIFHIKNNKAKSVDSLSPLGNPVYIKQFIKYEFDTIPKMKTVSYNLKLLKGQNFIKGKYFFELIFKTPFNVEDNFNLYYFEYAKYEFVIK
jgi:hypothetical protein